MTSSLNFSGSLTEKYRPADNRGFLGLPKPKRVLGTFAKKPFSSAWLFLGPPGIGKTSMALALAATIPAEFHHIPSRKCDLESVEETTRCCWYIPLSAKFHLVLVDEADQMTPAAQLALLSKLDATAAPPNTIFVFTANDTVLLERRFLSRCRVLEFSTAGINGELVAFLRSVWKVESSHPVPKDLAHLAASSGNNIRDVLSRLEVELMMGGETIPQPTPPCGDGQHAHRCSRCGNAWQHEDEACALPFKSACPNCDPRAGARTVYHERAAKAVRTRTENIQRELLREKARICEANHGRFH
ncbi:MAG TPA: AAA family ATPase [Terriglobales bacterium]|nr:AAA family ATPase [Terriglobales bacterium]